MERDNNSEGYEKKITEAIIEKNLEKLTKIIDELDWELTSYFSQRNLQPAQITWQKEEIWKLFGPEQSAHIYLSDWGVSRLVINIKGAIVNIFPSDTSSNEVKNKWKIIQ